MHYLDASVLVAAITEEISRKAVQNWLRSREDDLAFSHWTLTEVASALSIKLRTGQIDGHAKAASARQLEEMRNTFLVSTPIDETHFFAARKFADRHETGLRAGDALHVAIAADFDMTLVTLDRRMAAGATMLGVNAVLLPMVPGS